MTTKVPSIPSPTTNNLVQVSQAVKSLLDVREGLVGDKLDANVTFRDLIETGTVSLRPGWNGSTGTPVVPAFPTTPGGYNPSTDPTTPVQPTGVIATGLFAVVQLEWDTPDYQNHAYAEIWRAETNVIGSAIFIGTSDTSFYTDNLGVTETRYYWVRFVSQANITGPYQGVDGIAASSSSDPTYLMEILTDAYGATGDAPFFSVSAPTVINGVSIPAGTYIKQAFIADATISRAKIADAAIDNAKIANLDAAKITTGFLSADRIQAGTLDAKIANISAAVITSGTINSARIGDATITGAKIADATITSAKIADAAITNAKIANLAVGSAQIQDLAVSTLKIDNNAVTRSVISPGLNIFTRTPTDPILLQTLTIPNCIAGSVISISILFDRTQTSGDLMELYRHLNGVNALLFTYGAPFAGTSGYQDTVIISATAIAGTNVVGFGFKGKTTNNPANTLQITRWSLQATEFRK